VEFRATAFKNVIDKVIITKSKLPVFGLKMYYKEHLYLKRVPNFNAEALNDT
jgi:hypothetical protein